MCIVLAVSRGLVTVTVLKTFKDDLNESQVVVY
jgi:hypothetical protein